MENIYPTSPIQNQEKNQTESFSLSWIWYVLAAIAFTCVIICLVQANDFMSNGGIFMERYHSMREQYVGGDAYNYIIAGTYSTTITVRALIFTVLGTGCILAGKLTALKARQ